MPEGMLLSYSKLSVLGLFILNERVGDVVLFLLQDDEFDGTKFAELPTDIILLDLNG